MMIKQHRYSIKTQELIDRICDSKKQHKPDKRRGLEAVLKTYDLFGLNRPDIINLVEDVSDGEFERFSRIPRSMEVADSIWESSDAGKAWRGDSVSHVDSRINNAFTRVPYLGGNTAAPSSVAAILEYYRKQDSKPKRKFEQYESFIQWTAPSFVFEKFIFGFEYAQANKKCMTSDFPKYLEYCELYLQAAELGIMYISETLVVGKHILLLVPEVEEK